MSVKKPKIANSFQNFLKERKIIEANNGGVRVVARNNNISEYVTDAELELIDKAFDEQDEVGDPFAVEAK